MKSLLLGIVLIIIVGFGGLVYRNAVEHPQQPTTYQPPKISLTDVGIAYAVPEGFVATELPDSASAAAYEKIGPTPQEPSHIIIRRFGIPASSTPLSVIKETAIGSPSGLPVLTTNFSSISINDRQFTVVSVERFEAVINTAYYLARDTDVLRFDAIDRGVVGWMDPNLDVSTLPANAALQKLLATLEGV